MSESIQERFKITGIRNLEYDLIDALRRAKTQIMAGDYITDIAAALLVNQADYIDKLEDALRFYADPENYELVDPRNTLVDFDEGKRAREALGEDK